MTECKSPYVGFKEAALRSGLSVYFWRQAVANNRVPHIRSGKKFYIDYDRAIERLRGGEVIGG